MTRPLPPRAVWPVALVLFLVFFGIAEAGARYYDPWLPKTMPGNEQEIGIKVEQMTQNGPFEVAFVGASVFDTGIDAHAFGAATQTSAYNAGLLGLTPTFAPEWTNRAVLPRSKATVLVLDAGLYQMADYEARYAEQADLTDAAMTEALDKQFLSLGGRLVERLSDASVAYRNRSAWRTWELAHEAITAKSDGSPSLGELRAPPPNLDAAGRNLIARDQPQEATFAVPSEGLGSADSISGFSLERYDQMLSSVDIATNDVLIVVPPLAKVRVDALEARGYEVALLVDRMKANATEHGAAFVEFVTDGSFSDQDFTDGIHLSETGTQKFTALLAAFYEADRSSRSEP